MNWIRSHRQSAVLIALTLLLPLYFYVKTLLGLLGLGIDYSAERQRIEPRIARLQGLLENEEELRRQSALASERVNNLVVGAGVDESTLAASLQADVRRLVTEAGLSVSNSQIMPTRRDEIFDRIAVKVVVRGSLPSLDAALIALAAYRPQLLVESIDVYPARTASRGTDGGESQALSAVIQLMALRQQP